MSGHDHAHDHTAEELHDDDHHHEEPLPPEPESPAWLPLLGGGLFLAGLLFFLFTQSGETPNKAAPEGSSDTAAAAAQPARPAASALKLRAPVASALAPRPPAPRPAE